MLGPPAMDRPRDYFVELDSAELDEVSGGWGAGISTSGFGSGAPSAGFGMPSIGTNGIHVQSLGAAQAPSDTPLVQTFGSILSDTQGSRLDDGASNTGTPLVQTFGSNLSDSQGSPLDDGASTTVDRSSYFDRNAWAAQVDPDGSQPTDGTQSGSPGTQPAQPGSQDANPSNPDGAQDATQGDYFDRNPWAAQADPDGTQGADNGSAGQGNGYEPGGSSGGGNDNGGGGFSGDGGGGDGGGGDGGGD